MKRLNSAIFITGLSSSGKTTLAHKLIDKFKSENYNPLLLDGTEMYASSILYPFEGHEPEDRFSRSKHLTRIIKWISSQDILPIIPIVGQPIEIRDHWEAEIKDYVEIFLDCDIELCIQRDNKDLYNSIKKGEASSVIGIDRIYKKPLNAWLTIDSGKNNANKVFDLAWQKILGIEWLLNFKK